MRGGTLETYRAMIGSGALAPDSSQAFVAEELELLCHRLSRIPSERSELFSWLRPAAAPPKGLYLFGGVGAGKTMLMDLFVSTCPFTSKRRLHFQAFMSETHDLIAEARRAHDGDPIPLAAKRILSEAKLLCIDELEVRDIADAMIIGRLFPHLFDAGLVLVATSNTAPRDLYRDGLNRPLFEPFIRLVEERCDVIALEAARDYRRGRMEGRQRYFVPANESARQALDEIFARVAGQPKAQPVTLQIRGRRLTVPSAAMGVARFSFDELCEKPLGPDDYRAIAQSFHTVLLDNVPALGPERRNAARRFVTLIDALYDHQVALFASADAEPDALYAHGDGAAEFRRTASRLIEMRDTDLRARRTAPAENQPQGGLAAQQSFGQTSPNG